MCPFAILFFFKITNSIARTDCVTVFAAANLKNALDEIGGSSEQTGSNALIFNFAGSSQVARQVIADVLITANTLWTDEVKKARSIPPNSRFDVTSNQLIIASNQRQTTQHYHDMILAP